MTNPEAPPGWITLTDLARQRQVDKSAVSRRVARFEVLGLLSTRKIGKVKLINLAEFNQAVTATVDGVRELNGRGATGPPPEAGALIVGDPVLAKEQARRVGIQADLAQLELDKQRRLVVDLKAVRASLGDCAIELVRAIDALPARADVLTPVLVAAMTKDGAEGVRAALRAADRAFLRHVRTTLARAVERFAENDDLGEAEATEAAPEEAAA